MLKIFKNKEFRLMTCSFTIISLLFLACAIFVFNFFINQVNSQYLRQNISTVGSLVKNYSAAENEIVKNFIGGYGSDYEYGKKVLSKYSYNDKLSPEKNVLMNNTLYLTFIFSFLITVLLLVAFYVFFYVSFSKIYNKIRVVSAKSERVIEGDYLPLEDDIKDGEIGLLTHQFNIMIERLGENVESLKNDKNLLRSMITDISHQLKTPLASLLMYNEILLNNDDVPENDKQMFLNESQKQIERMEWLIKSILKMSKLEAGIIEFNKENLSISCTIQNSISNLNFLTKSKNIKISTNGSKDVYVPHDVMWTTEALTNIIKNCLEHTQPEGEIEINWEENAVFVQITIVDNGIGIDKSEIRKIFNRFYKGERSVSPENVGIGLYITKTIIESQNGTITVESKVGKGTKFIVNLMKV